jgi:hypothetical protein
LNWNLAEPSNPFQIYHANGAIDGEVMVQFKGILPARIMRPTDESLINNAQLTSLIYEIWTAESGKLYAVFDLDRSIAFEPDHSE